MKKIYSKFVKDRKKTFQIETALWEENGVKYVSKKNLYEEGLAHINNIIETYETYKETGLLCPVKKVDDKVVFDYLSGNTLESLFIDALKRQDVDAVKSYAEKYNNIVSIVCNDSSSIFDLTFDNIIWVDNIPKVIDYEWRFLVPIEKEFIKFRAVFAFEMKYNSYISQVFSKEHFYNLFDVCLENENRYITYNEQFINYVYGEDGYNNIIKKYEKNSIYLFNEENMTMLKNRAKRQALGEDTYENRNFNNLLGFIEKNKEKYDDYTKFFKVTQKLKDISSYGYTETDEYLFEFSAYIQDVYNMIDFYKEQINSKDEEILLLRQKEAELYQQLQNTFDRKVKRRLDKVKSIVTKKKG